ncbi:MAG: ATP-grasp domain-containing protein [bacterium]|nr:ATP-grasp domain-containing protein [bacterium]
MSEILVLAIGRAEKPLQTAINRLSYDIGQKIKGILLVNEAFAVTPAYRGNESPDHFSELIIDFNNSDILEKTVVDLTKSKKIIIHCRMEEAIKDLQQVIPFLPKGTLAPSVDSLKNANEKYLTRTILQKNNSELSPKFVNIVKLADYIESMVSDFAFPVIVKPNGLHSSFFVNKCESLSELEDALESAFTGIEKIYKRDYGTGMPSVLIEEFMEGEMFSVDSYTDSKGKTSFLPPVKVMTAAEAGKIGFYGYMYSLPSALSADETNEANDAVNLTINSLGLTSCVAHTELMKTNKGWKIIETGPRIGGYRQQLYESAYGIDHYYNDLTLHYNDETDTQKKWIKNSAGLTFYPDTEGEIVDITGVSKLKSLSTYYWHSVDANICDKAVFATNGGELSAIVILSGSDKQQIENDITELRNSLIIKVV